MKSPEEKGQEIYDQMKGFRITNKHRKKCALVCADQLIEQALPDGGLLYSNKKEIDNTFRSKAFYESVKKYIQNIPV